MAVVSEDERCRPRCSLFWQRGPGVIRHTEGSIACIPEISSKTCLGPSPVRIRSRRNADQPTIVCEGIPKGHDCGEGGRIDTGPRRRRRGKRCCLCTLKEEGQRDGGSHQLRNAHKANSRSHVERGRKRRSWLWIQQRERQRQQRRQYKGTSGSGLAPVSACRTRCRGCGIGPASVCARWRNGGSSSEPRDLHRRSRSCFHADCIVIAKAEPGVEDIAWTENADRPARREYTPHLPACSLSVIESPMPL